MKCLSIALDRLSLLSLSLSAVKDCQRNKITIYVIQKRKKHTFLFISITILLKMLLAMVTMVRQCSVIVISCCGSVATRSVTPVTVTISMSITMTMSWARPKKWKPLCHFFIKKHSKLLSAWLLWLICF